MKAANFKLNVTEKNGKFHYQVTDQKGNVISERKSNRKYVACTASGSHYFGRLDLIGKGDHGSCLNNCEKIAKMTEEQFYNHYKSAFFSGKYHEEIESKKECIKRLNSIAYL
jgi:hypothetical protein